ncbi:PEP-CTERM sorting domain-containing protein [Humisphaera borealis]|uniref:PEP-CTERM sorting domain-containing protein n=1 Tax=Humisphaera borealis TaxID=2807512 RepID=A0A7M2WPH4_9BACT|nr:PEP-CTERM sorting domain-containing protein [Humisphaera borealis]QOV87309.1 PEP-CTERM sorting domain-containing protein [Humisphaera borealis]
MRKLTVLFAVALGASLVGSNVARAADVTLSVVVNPTSASAGTYAVFGTISNPNSIAGALGGQVAGISSFSIDILGNGGTSITTRARRMPTGLLDTNDFLSSYGFVQFPSNGTLAGGSVAGLAAGQKTAYAGGNDPAQDAFVVLGVGRAAGSYAPIGGTTSTFANPVLLADGSYSGGTGSITARVTSGNFFNLLQDTSAASGLQWTGPGNVEAAVSVIPATTPVPEPGTLAVTASLVVGLLLRRRSRTLA